MGIRQDYLKKQFDQMAKIIGKLLADLIGLKNDSRITEAVSLVDKVFETDLHFNFDELLKVEDDKLINFLTKEKQFSLETIEGIANILFELGDAFEDKNKKQHYFKKAISLFQYLAKERKTVSFDFMIKINKMNEK